MTMEEMLPSAFFPLLAPFWRVAFEPRCCKNRMNPMTVS